VIGLGQSASFLKKRSKKLLLIWAVVVSTPQPQRNQKFFAPLFFKKAAAYLSPLNPIKL
jgi:hypothetical protein